MKSLIKNKSNSPIKMALDYNAEIAKHMNSFFVNRDKLASKIHPSEFAFDT